MYIENKEINKRIQETRVENLRLETNVMKDVESHICEILSSKQGNTSTTLITRSGNSPLRYTKKKTCDQPYSDITQGDAVLIEKQEPLFVNKTYLPEREE